MNIEAKSFTIPELKGISTTSVEEHLKLYQGYVKHANLINEILTGAKPEAGDERLPYALREVQRRFAFEYNGIKNHEYYFEQLEVGARPISADSLLYQAIEAQWGSWDSWLEQFMLLAKTRGIGWAILYHDTERNILINSWVDEQHLGQLNSCKFIFGIDMWEHSYVYDYQPSGKAIYISDYLTNTNWSVAESRFIN